MSSAAQTEQIDESSAAMQQDDPTVVPVPELVPSFTAAQVEAAVEQAVGDGGSFDGDLDAKFRVLSACAELLGGRRVPNALLHAVHTPQQLTEYYLATLVSDDGVTASRIEDLPANLTLDDRDEAMMDRVLRTGA